MPSPTESQQPSSSWHDRKKSGWRDGVTRFITPTVETHARGESIHGLPSKAADVLRGVPEHIGQRIPDLARSLQHVRMEALEEDASPSTPQLIELSRSAADRKPDHEPLHAARQALLVLRFDEQMQMIPHHHEVIQPESEALLAAVEGGEERSVFQLSTKIGQAASQLERDVDWMVPRKRGPPGVRNPALLLLRSSRTRPRSTPTRKRQFGVSSLACHTWLRLLAPGSVSGDEMKSGVSAARSSQRVE